MLTNLPILYDLCVGDPISRRRLLTVGSTPVLHSVLNVKALVGENRLWNRWSTTQQQPREFVTWYSPCEGLPLCPLCPPCHPAPPPHLADRGSLPIYITGEGCRPKCISHCMPWKSMNVPTYVHECFTFCESFMPFLMMLLWCFTKPICRNIISLTLLHSKWT